jgi:hypothetical protein
MTERKTYNLAEIIRKELDRKLDFVFEADGGKTFTIPSPLVWPPKVRKMPMVTMDDDDAVVAALIGKEQFKELLASTVTIDGTAYPLNGTLIVRALQHELGASMGESQASTDS